ncbi:MAG TPA: response regulator [Candidatus Sulfotelmatobacter sp.]|nr:response regulator [Candidatus Sulfotelmatobacter sp.]
MARKILLADDSVTAQNMGRKILADAGYEVITVNNGSAALKKIGEQHPDLIVLDVYMPGYSGLEVCQRLKEAGDTAQIPILLTVGKLEPFKPEEVRRVRADAFIVKPFEASELLSALSKLEDRIVPRSEPSKPGRFARATAAIDEGRYDKHAAAAEEESGWKNRIRFPSSKKEKGKEAQPEPDEAAVYSTGNKDLRTVIEHKIAESPANGREKEKEEDRVDLGALAPIGLPKDVTPEEIAALAAAAAQMQGKIAENKISASEPEAAPTPVIEQSKPESKEDLRSETAPEVPPVAAITEPKAAEQAEAKSAEAAAAGSFASSDSASHSAPHESSADEPVTMAVGGSTSDAVQGSRWTAVSVALAPEDAAISLEEEMQKAYTAFAAAETGHAGSTPSSSESALAPSTAPVENASSEPVVSVPASVAPEAAQALSAVASAATDAMSAAAEELQAVASSYVEPKEPTTSVIADPAATSAPVEAVAEQKSESAIPQAEAEKSAVEQQAQSSATDTRADESKDAPHADVPSVVAEIPAEPAAGSVASSAESVPAAQAAEAPIEKESDMAASTAAAWANWRQSHQPDNSAPAASPQELAAKAVAAGFESSPEEVPADNGSDLASIVDSVLADLRPRIVEEISRKLGKKK